MKRIGIVYHRSDLDGIGSYHITAWALASSDPNIEITPLPWEYGDPLPEVYGFTQIYLVDISLPTLTMKTLHDYYGDNFIWIDHHKTSLQDSIDQGYDGANGIRTDGLPSAIELCLEFFQKNINLFQGARLLSLYDTWRKEDPEFNWEEVILPFQVGFKAEFFHAPKKFNLEDTMEFVVQLKEPLRFIRKGRDVLEYQKKIHESSAKRAYPLDIHGIRFAAVNQGEVNSTVMDSVAFDYEAMFIYRYDGTNRKWRVSLFAEENCPHDLSVIAKSYPGGGGHRHACGFEVEDITPFLNHNPHG